MSLREKIDADLKSALKGGNKLQAQTIRGLKSAIKYAEIENGDGLDEEGVLAVVAKQAKQRRDAMDDFTKGGRQDLVDNEAAELAILERYLPAQMSEAEVEVKVQAILTELGVSDMKGMGQVMSRAMAELKGQADGKVVNGIVRKLLSS